MGVGVGAESGCADKSWAAVWGQRLEPWEVTAGGEEGPQRGGPHSVGPSVRVKKTGDS